MKDSNTSIRPACESDIPGLVLIGGEFFKQTGYAERGLACDPFHLHQFLAHAIASDSHAVLVADIGGAVQGVIGAVASPTFFSPQLVASELFWWMNPQARKGRSALLLLRALEQWAADKGCAVLSMVDIALMRSNAPDIYMRRDYQLAERSWIKTFKEKAWQQ